MRGLNLTLVMAGNKKLCAFIFILHVEETQLLQWTWCYNKHIVMFSLKLNIFSIILVSLKVIHSRVITGTVPLKQPGARCFAQGHNHRLNWERIDGKCFQVNGEKMIGSLTANPFYFICVCCSLTVYHRRSVGYDDTSLSFGGFKLTSPIFNC